MTRKIHPGESTFPVIRDTSPTPPRIDPARIAEALGAEPSGERLQGALAPVTLFALREELINRLQSSGGRPGLAGATRRAKIPLNDQEWLKLEELAAAVSSPGFSPSAGQIASVLLTLSLHAVTAKVASGTAAKSLVRELADAVAAESSHG
jgi:hypothetical protein